MQGGTWVTINFYWLYCLLASEIERQTDYMSLAPKNTGVEKMSNSNFLNVRSTSANANSCLFGGCCATLYGYGIL